MKACQKCAVIQPITSFGSNRARPDGHQDRCQACCREDGREWYAKHKESERLKRLTPEGKERAIRHSQYKSARYHGDSEHRKKVKDRERKRGQKVEVKARRRELAKAYHEHKQASDPIYRLRRTLRARVREALKGACKAGKTMELTGCSPEALRAHLESLWKPGMTWENHGLHGWHIDHIIPCAAFDLADPQEQRKCFHYSNLQPLWGLENLSKSDWVPDYQI